MMRQKRSKAILKAAGVFLCVAMATPAFTQSAPVFDADTMQQDIEASNAGVDPSQDVLPPPPGQENGFAQGPEPMPAAAYQPPPQSSASDQRIRQLEEQVKRMQTEGSSARVEALQQEVQTLRGQVDELNHQLQQAQNQQKSMYADIDKRIESNKPPVVADNTVADHSPAAQTEAPAEEKPAAQLPKPAAQAKPARIANATKVAMNTPKAAPSQDQPNVAEEQKIYQTAYNLIKAKKYNEAVDALQAMLKKYPTGQFASNAHYWLGELYGLLGKNDRALAEFSIVVKSYSSSPRVSDAQFKIGLIYAADVKWAEAKAAFKKVINQYPGSTSAKLATVQLKQIKDAGH